LPSTRSSADRSAGRRARARTLALLTLLAVGAGLALVVAVVDDGSQPAGRASGRPFVADGSTEVGEPAPDFALPRLDGPGLVRLSDYRGRPVVVNFWASWCNPCRREFPLLAAARVAHADRGLEVIGVTYRDIAADSRAFAASRDADWPLARDPDGTLATRYGVRAIPQTYFIAADGTISARLFGVTRAELDAEIARIVRDRSSRP
jgi:cytochrome c biogenesis protein CcmG/thiol:disulfide interchange protein DsbE